MVLRPAVEGWTFVETKTDKSRRTIKLAGTAVDALRGWRARQGREHLAAGSEWQGDKWGGLVFTSLLGGPLPKEQTGDWFRRTLLRTGLPPQRVHDLRHAAASNLLGAGVPLFLVSRMLGHSSISITADTYGHLVSDNTSVADRMDAILGRPAVSG